MLRPKFLASSALALSLAVSPLSALAQGLSTSELWQSWQERVADVGGKLSAREQREGNRLQLSNIRLELDEKAQTTLGIDSLVLTSQADGSVAVTLPESFPLALTHVTPGNDTDTAPRTHDLILDVAMPGAAITVRGLAERADFQAILPSASIMLQEIDPPLLDPKTGNPIKGILSLALSDLDLRYQQEIKADQGAGNGALSLGNLTGNMAFDEESGTSLRFTLDLADIDSALAFNLPPSSLALLSSTEPSPAPLLRALADGLLASVSVKHGASTMSFDLQSPDQGHNALDVGVDGSSFSFSFDKQGLSHETRTSNSRFKLIADPEIVPGGEASVSLAGFETRLKFGLGDLIKPQDWALGFGLRGLEMSPSLWSLADPEANMAHDPLTTVLQLTGSHTFAPEVRDPAWRLPAASAGDPTGGLAQIFSQLSVNLQELLIEGIGLAISGQGKLDLDMKDLDTWDGFPAPTGGLQFRIKGAYALLDHLQGLGLVGPDERSGALAVLALIGKLGSEPDVLDSRLEFKDRSFHLNGVKLR